MSEYKLHWRNLTVDWVNWERKTLRFVFDNGKAMTIMFKDLYDGIDSNSDEQCIKMIMDRHIVRVFSKHMYPTEEVKEYITDIFRNPYEWTTCLLEEAK